MNRVSAEISEPPSWTLSPEWKIETIRDSSDGLTLRYGTFGASKKPKHYIVLLNGRTEFIEKYSYLPGDIQLPEDWGFLTIDHRGQGGSGGARGYVESYDCYVDDLRRILDRVVGDTPYRILAHSMGSLIGLYGYLKGQLQPERLVLMSPLLGLPKKPIPPPAARSLAKGVTRAGLGYTSTQFGRSHKLPFRLNRLTHSYHHFDRIRNAPFDLPTVTFGWIDATYQAIDFVFSQEALQRIDKPITIAGSPDEGIVDPAAWGEWVNAALDAHPASKKLVDYHLIHGAKHELLTEIPKYYDRALDIIHGRLYL